MAVKQEQSTRKHGGPRRKLKQETIEKIKDLSKNEQLSNVDIAKIADVDRSTVSRLLQSYKIDNASLAEDKKQLGNVFLDLSMRYARSITEDDIKRTPAGTRITAMAIAYDKYRLETGQSTENVSIITRLAQAFKETQFNNDND
jgi:hypothetical protein